MSLGTELDALVKMGNIGPFQFIHIYKIMAGTNSFLPSTCRGLKEIKDNV